MFGLFESNESQAEKWHNKGLAACKNYDFINSFECYKKSVELNPNNPVVWYEMSVLVGQHGHDWQMAKLCAENALSIDPENFPQAWKGLAIIEKHLGNIDRAIELFKMLVDKYGWNPDKDPAVKEPTRKWLVENNIILYSSVKIG